MGSVMNSTERKRDGEMERDGEEGRKKGRNIKEKNNKEA